LDVMQICDGAKGWCDLVWLVDAAAPGLGAQPMRRVRGG
jgi:hypothetical protein